MAKISIKSTKQMEVSIDVTVPAFFRDKQLDRYVAILSANDHITVTNFISNKIIAYHAFLPILDLDHVEPIRCEDFEAAMSKCKCDIDLLVMDRTNCILKHSHDITAIPGH